MSSEPVFACTLPPRELRQRRVDVLTSVRRRAVRVEEVPDGFTFFFSRTPDLETELAEFVRFEAACCSFIAMDLEDLPDGRIALRLKGVPEAKPLMRMEFVDVGGEASIAGARGCGCP